MIQGYVALYRGEADPALTAFDRALELARWAVGEETREAASALEGRGNSLILLSRLPEAEAPLRRAVAILEKVVGPRHPSLASACVNLGDFLDRLGRKAESERMLRRGLEIHRAARGDDHPMVADTRAKLGYTLMTRRRYAEARRELEAALAVFERLDHFDAGSCLRYLGTLDLSENRYTEALEHYQRAERFLARKLGEDAYLVWIARGNVADALLQLGRLAEAESLQRLTEMRGPQSDEIRTPMKQLGVILRRRGRAREALELHRRARRSS
jgi:tetratricopeptide (TPR) repeat protein